MTLSQSEWHRYLTCPRQYAWRGAPETLTADKALRIAMGQIFDTVIGTFYREQWWTVRHALEVKALTLFEREARRRIAEYGLTETPQALVDLLYASWQGVLTTIAAEQLMGEAIYVHTDFQRVLDGHRLFGQPDLVFVTPTRVLVLDIKKGAGSYIRPSQLRYYRYLLAAHFSQPMRSGFWLIENARIRWARQKDTDLDAVETSLRAVLVAITQQIFDPTPGPACFRCDLRARCPEGIRHLQGTLPVNGLPADPGVHTTSF